MLANGGDSDFHMPLLKGAFRFPCIVKWGKHSMGCRILIVVSSDAGEVLERFIHNHLVFCSKVKSYFYGWVNGCR